MGRNLHELRAKGRRVPDVGGIMTQLLIKIAVYEGGGFSHVEHRASRLISTDMLKKELTFDSTIEAHKMLNQLIDEYLAKKLSGETTEK